MINPRPLFELHRLTHAGFSLRKIARTLGIARRTAQKYLAEPNPPRPRWRRPSLRDPLHDEIERLLPIDPTASAVVIRQRLEAQGFHGGLSLLRQHLRQGRAHQTPQPTIRFETPPGHQCQVDWGHFGALTYGNTARNLYCLAVVEGHSRLRYLEFTHSQRQEPLPQCLLNAFHFFQGTPRELVHDNMLSAVVERQGPLVRFNDHFLAFLRPFKITPIACNGRQPQEKGKVEQGAIHYIRYNVWPLRTFRDLPDLQRQANEWRAQVANVRLHSTTGQRPVDRFDPTAMHPLPALLPDCRDTVQAKVHTDVAVHFDGNTSTVPPWLVGNTLTVKADHHPLTCYLQDKAVATHPRCWLRKQRLELPQHREMAPKHHRRSWHSQEVAALISLGEGAKTYLERLARTQQPLTKSVKKLLALKDEYGAHALIEAMQRALHQQAIGVHYIANILYQEMPPQRHHPPVRLKQAHLNHLRLEAPSLADYDAFVSRRKTR
jgi:transposase